MIRAPARLSLTGKRLLAHAAMMALLEFLLPRAIRYWQYIEYFLMTFSEEIFYIFRLVEGNIDVLRDEVLPNAKGTAARGDAPVCRSRSN